MLTITYDKLRKSVRINGRLARHSVETAAVVDVADNALAAGEVCLHAADGVARAVWAVESGEVACDTRWRSADGESAWQQMELRVKDGDGNLLGKGCVEVVESCAGHDESTIEISGGPLVMEAGASIAVGWPVRASQGLAMPCTAGEHESWVGIALGAADEGDNVEVQRWGAVYVEGWSLTPGVSYWLPQNAGALANQPADVALMAGVAQDAETLILTGGRLAVQPVPAPDGEVYLRWHSTLKRLIEMRPAESGGDAAAGKIPRLDPAGMLPPTMIPTVPVVAIARRVVSDLVRGLSLGNDPTYSDVLEVLFRLLTAMRTADQAPAEGGSIGDDELPEFRGIIDDAQLAGDTQTTWSSAKILAYIMAHSAMAVQVLPDVADEASLPDPAELERASLVYVIAEGSQYWCSGPSADWVKMGSEAATITQVNAAIEAALEQVLEDIEDLQGDVAKVYTKDEVDGFLADKADDGTTTSALEERYTKDEVDGLLGDKADASELDDYYDKTTSDSRYDRAQWTSLTISNQSDKLTEGTTISAKKRGGVVSLQGTLHCRSAASGVASGTKLFEVSGATLHGPAVVHLERLGLVHHARLEADGSLVLIAILPRSGALTGDSTPWQLSATVACA